MKLKEVIKDKEYLQALWEEIDRQSTGFHRYSGFDAEAYQIKSSDDLLSIEVRCFDKDEAPYYDIEIIAAYYYPDRETEIILSRNQAKELENNLYELFY